MTRSVLRAFRHGWVIWKAEGDALAMVRCGKDGIWRAITIYNDGKVEA